MKATVEWITTGVGLIRVGSQHECHGDPYEAVCTIVYNFPDESDEVFIMGLCGKFNRETFRAIKDALQAEGISKAKYERIKPHPTGTLILMRREKS